MSAGFPSSGCPSVLLPSEDESVETPDDALRSVTVPDDPVSGDVGVAPYPMVKCLFTPVRSWSSHLRS